MKWIEERRGDVFNFFMQQHLGILRPGTQATSSEPDAIFFAKLPEQSGGRGIRVLSREATLPSTHGVS